MSRLPARARILLVRTSAIGDIVFASGLPAALREEHPDAHIAWLVEAGLEDLLRGDPAIDEVLTWPRSQWQQLWRAGRRGPLLRAMREFRAGLRARRFDVAIDLQGLLKSGLLAWMSGASRRIGLNSREGSGFLMHEVVKGHGRIERFGSEYQHLAQALGLRHEPFMPQLHVPAAVQDSAAGLLAARGLHPGSYVLIAPFTTRPQKHWFDDAWRDLARGVGTRLGLPVLMLGAPGDRERARNLRAGTSGIVDLTGETGLGEAMWLVRHAGLVVGVDTGLTHMGIAFDRPTVALFGSTRPYLETGRERARVIWLGLDCSPCRRHPTCAGAFTCLRQISPDMVLEQTLRVYAA